MEVLLKNGCSVRQFFEKYLQNSPFLVNLETGGLKCCSFISDSFIELFQGKLIFTWKIYRTASFITVTLHLIFQTDISKDCSTGC